MVKELFIVRHGETNYNLEERIQGQIDSEAYLSKKGIEQVDKLGRKISALDIKYDKIYSSDQKRAKQTTEAISKYLNNIPIEFTTDLRERGFGDLEGKTIQECDIQDYKGANLYNLDNEGILATAESLISIRNRAKELIKKILNSKDKKIILVGHEWMNSYIINLLLKEEGIFHPQNNAGVQYFKLEDNGKVVEYRLDDNK
ncbi:MAG: histidine phosphatase family protein [Candidatus Pacearchaeota archaeon]